MPETEGTNKEELENIIIWTTSPIPRTKRQVVSITVLSTCTAQQYTPCLIIQQRWPSIRSNRWQSDP